MFPDSNYPSAYLDALPAYNLNAGVDTMLDLAREILTVDNYYFLGVAFPTGTDILIPANGTFVGNVSVEPLSYVTMITGFSDQPSGFKLRIYDKGAKADIIDRQFISSRNIASQMEGVFPGVTPADTPFGPYMLISPFIVLNPGSLQIEITNLSLLAANIQILLGCAIPVTDRSINIKDIQG